jgi:hypothetical protein
MLNARRASSGLAKDGFLRESRTPIRNKRASVGRRMQARDGPSRQFSDAAIAQ